MNRLILFAKRPRLGKVKTRMVPPLSAEQALELYRVFLEDSARLVLALAEATALNTVGGIETELCLDGVAADDALPPSAARLPRTEQGPGDLGARLLRAFRRSRAEGSAATVVIGADSPNLPPERIAAAFENLREAPNPVMAPSLDGGYVLIGLSGSERGLSEAELFRDVPWGGPEVAGTTRDRALAQGTPLIELQPWYDVDDAASLRRLRADLEDCGDATAAATRAHLSSLDGVYSAML